MTASTDEQSSHRYSVVKLRCGITVTVDVGSYGGESTTVELLRDDRTRAGLIIQPTLAAAIESACTALMVMGHAADAWTLRKLWAGQKGGGRG